LGVCAGGDGVDGTEGVGSGRYGAPGLFGDDGVGIGIGDGGVGRWAGA